ncbi:hypothetical protein SMA679_0804 [Streptococcus macedonicus]|nr:hypothetical protein SMA679_0804 [Streptococcus macedonicus]
MGSRMIVRQNIAQKRHLVVLIRIHFLSKVALSVICDPFISYLS